MSERRNRMQEAYERLLYRQLEREMGDRVERSMREYYSKISSALKAEDARDE